MTSCTCRVTHVKNEVCVVQVTLCDKSWNYERTRFYHDSTKHIHGLLFTQWQTFGHSIRVNPVMMATIKTWMDDDFNFTMWNAWFCSFLVSVNSLWRKKVLNIASIKGYVCKTQIDAQPLIYVQSSNRRPMTYVLNNVTPVRVGFWSNEGSCQEIKDIPSREKVFVVKNINASTTFELNRYQLRPCST